ncbi:hypothetical protein GCM10025859_18250 [Alicyclobacillus fastidiosus]|nr:hypothetical protein GCM10025859_18250 [Alicyclobacillus fastidiosus]
MRETRSYGLMREGWATSPLLYNKCTDGHMTIQFGYSHLVEYLGSFSLLLIVDYIFSQKKAVA